jgi:hypothetical protein
LKEKRLSELAELYLLFLVLYLFECLAWVPRRAVGFFAFAGRWRGRLALRPNASWSIAVVIGKPWPPLSPPWLAEPLPFALDAEGITLIESDMRRLAWEELQPVSARGNRVEGGDVLLATLASRKGASTLAAALEKTRTSPAKKREAGLRRFLDARFDLDAPLVRQKEFQASVRVLRVCSNALWLALFGGLGVAVFTRSMLVLLGAAVLSLLLWPVNSFVFHFTVRKLATTWLPRAQGPDIPKRLVAMLSPISGVRCVDMLAREVWANVDPMAVAAALLSAQELQKFARPFLVAMQAHDGDALTWWRAEIRQRIERVLAQKNINVAAMLAPPAREGDHVETYCPSCLSQYESGRKAGEPCPNESCPDIPLRAFDENGATQ